MGIEIERKFLVNHELWDQLDKPKGDAINQGYMLREPGKTIRIRIRNEEGFITIKGKSVSFSHSEHEYAIPVKDAQELLAAFCDGVVIKVRYCISYAGKLWEVDVFEGDNAGLIMAEIELDSEAETFEIPAWITEEVTTDDRYYNSNLLVNPYKNWA